MIMAFFSSAINILQTLVVAIGAGLGVWGVIRQIKRCLFRQIKTGLSEHLTME